jgi:hypothetical protein
MRHRAALLVSGCYLTGVVLSALNVFTSGDNLAGVLPILLTAPVSVMIFAAPESLVSVPGVVISVAIGAIVNAVTIFYIVKLVAASFGAVRRSG